MKLFIVTAFLLLSCAGGVANQRTVLSSSSNKFILTDASGKFNVERQIKVTGNKVLTRSILSNWKNSGEILEKSVTVSKSGRLRSGEYSLLPEASQFSVWFDKDRYFSQIKIDRKKRQLEILKKSPEKKWNGKEAVKAPSGKYFCFFSSLPECVISLNLLIKSRKGKIPIYLIWDSYPYYKEQYQGITGEVLSLAQFSFANMVEESLRFELDIGNQIIFYHFDKELKFEKMFWVSQGISLERINK